MREGGRGGGEGGREREIKRRGGREGEEEERRRRKGKWDGRKGRERKEGEEGSLSARSLETPALPQQQRSCVIAICSIQCLHSG